MWSGINKLAPDGSQRYSLDKDVRILIGDILEVYWPLEGSWAGMLETYWRNRRTSLYKDKVTLTQLNLAGVKWFVDNSHLAPVHVAEGAEGEWAHLERFEVRVASQRCPTVQHASPPPLPLVCVCS